MLQKLTKLQPANVKLRWLRTDFRRSCAGRRETASKDRAGFNHTHPLHTLLHNSVGAKRSGCERWSFFSEVNFLELLDDVTRDGDRSVRAMERKEQASSRIAAHNNF